MSQVRSPDRQTCSLAAWPAYSPRHVSNSTCEPVGSQKVI